jgi:hypothetical protein
MAKSSNRTIEGWLARVRPVARLRHMRDRETIDAELRLLAAVRRSIRGHGGQPSSRQVRKKEPSPTKSRPTTYRPAQGPRHRVDY